MNIRLPWLLLLLVALFGRASHARDPPLLADFKKNHITTVNGANSECDVMMGRTVITECKSINTFIVSPGRLQNLCTQLYNNDNRNNNYISTRRFTVVHCRGRFVTNVGCVYTKERVLNRRVIVSCIVDRFRQDTYPTHFVTTTA